MSTTDEVYLHVVRRQTHLELLALELYGSMDSALARDFLHYNQLAANQYNEVLEGQLLYLPKLICYDPAVETGIINLIGRINRQIVNGMDAPQRRLIADNPQLVNNVSEDPNLLLDGVSIGNSLAGSIISFSSEANKMVGESLKELERAYVNAFQAHGKLTSHFYEKRRQIYSRLDTAIGRYGRSITMGSALGDRAKDALKISTKSQVIQWKRLGAAENVDAFQTHFDRYSRTSRYLKAGGYLTMAIGISVNELNIREACKTDSENCDFTKYSLRGETAGGIAGAAGGGALATWGTCTLAFGLPSWGTSAFWCGIVAGTTGSLVGGYAGSKFGKAGGELIYERTIR
ncbi:hypothetical protein [Marinobacter sp. LN3S78]|uniref:hypothetical protein n=1 Tax=Marinobacter sp. LN3S78 TaxID=3382300 RepID=UPI00387AFED2